MYIILKNDTTGSEFAHEDLVMAQRYALRWQCDPEHSQPGQRHLAAIYLQPPSAEWSGTISLPNFLGLALFRDDGYRAMPAASASYRILYDLLHDPERRQDLPRHRAETFIRYLQSFHLAMERGIPPCEFELRHSLDNFLYQLGLSHGHLLPPSYYALMQRPLYYHQAPMPKRKTAHSRRYALP
ncbi:MAG: hypothetical protein EA401_01390 [Planctomycetota bacterium]|nr:MAG: hypothetical protein EA401_01390 [Planctomycetota bacterium]